MRSSRHQVPTQDAGWIAQQTIRSYGVRIGIRTNRNDMLQLLANHLPPIWKPSSVSHVDRMFSIRLISGGARRPRYGFRQDREPEVTLTTVEDALYVFENHMKWSVARLARRRVFVHAGVVGWRGRAILLPGYSMSGKTSLVAALVRAGARYYSDEYAVLDMSGRVHPYPQPLEIRHEGESKQEKHPVEEIGGTPGRKPIQVGLVVFSEFRAGARWHSSNLTRGQAVLELLAQTMPARRKPEVVIPTLSRAVSGAARIRAVRGEAGPTARIILDAFESNEMQ